jgi:hypothetical protein
MGTLHTGLRYWAADVGFLAIEPLGTCRFGSSGFNKYGSNTGYFCLNTGS